MKKLLILFTLLISSAFFSPAHSQKKFDFKTSRQLFDEADVFFQEKKYDLAYGAYMKVNYNDTAYFSARFNAIYCASAMDKYDTIIEIATLLTADKRKNQFSESFANSLVVAYNGKKEFERALSQADLSLKKFPNSYLLYYNKGLALIGLEKIDEAVKSLQQSITINPRFAAAQGRLGYLCAKSGQFTKASLCYNMAIINTAGKESSIKYIVALSEIYDGDIKGDTYNIKYRENEDFEDIDVLILNKVAYNPKYKVKLDLNDNLFKTNHLVFNTLEYETGSNGFWNQNYVRFFKEVMKSGQFPYLCYYQVLALNDVNIQNVINKNKKKVVAFIDYASVLTGTCFNERLIWNGKDYVANTFNHFGGYGYNEIRTIKNNKVEGLVQTISNRGIIKSEGYMNDASKIDGLWKFYDDEGRIKTTVTYKNGVMDGERVTYYENGSRNSIMTVKNNNKIGEEKKFYNFNQIYSTVTYDNNGIENGPATYYHLTGAVSHKFNLVNNKIEGEFEEFYSNKQLKSKYTYVAGKIEGVSLSYFKNGQLQSKGNYANVPTGEWFFYHDNGKLESTGLFKDGNRIGVWKTYTDKEVIFEETDYGETGKKTGTYKSYDVDGNLEFELVYKGEEIVSYKTFDNKGVVIKEAVKKKNTLDIELYHENGTVSTKGSYTKSNKTGLWEYFNPYGVLITSMYYDDNGKLEGKVNRYHDNGKIKNLEEYKNNNLDGYIINYHDNGKIASHGWYSENAPIGPWEYFYRDGALKTEQYFLSEENHGEVRYYNKKGVLDEIGYYFYGTYEGSEQFDTLGNSIDKSMLKDGKGTIKYVYANKKLNGALDYIGGIQHGKIEWYYPDSTLRSKGEQLNDQKNGIWTYYYRNGKISSQGNYIDGLEEGEWIWYFEIGEIEVKRTFRNGNTEGTKHNYYDNGKLASTMDYINDERHGKATYFDPQGEIQLEKYYVNGILVGHSYLGKDKKMLPMIPFDIKTGKIEAYFWNGKKSYEATLPRGIYQGQVNYYGATGHLLEHYNYIDDMEDGVTKMYYENGKIKSETTLKENYNQGTASEYYANGKLKSIKTYHLGELNGWAYFYAENGDLRESIYFYDNDPIVKK